MREREEEDKLKRTDDGYKTYLISLNSVHEIEIRSVPNRNQLQRLTWPTFRI